MIKFTCKCGKAFKVDDKYANKKAKCSCGAILTVPSQTVIHNKTITSSKSQTNTITEAFIAISIGLIALILVLSFVCGAILTMPDKDGIAAQVGQIEQDIRQAKNECEQLEEQIVEFKKANDPVVCNKFKLMHRIADSTLELSVNTDLPDDTVVMVSVSRSYWKEISPDEYSIDYLSEKSTVAEWKLKHEISISNEKWENSLKARQKQMSKIGLGFNIARVSDKINARIVIPINQPNPKFGKKNSDLVGKAVRTTGLHVVEDEIEISYPFVSRFAEK